MTATSCSPSTSGTSPDRTRTSVDVVGELGERRAHRVAGPARDVLEREPAAVADDLADGLGRRRVDDDRAPAARRAAVELRGAASHASRT